ncbi:MAG: hypothetical protein H6737_01400 [Alphaproteobacteria bacterium]|nr:hypothetical protein [Myxococcales bacterium]MCB9673738.1 hypothetical protein [Alphaproteobacteria bacterium]
MILDDLLQLDRPALGELLKAGHPVDPEALRNREFNGVSLGLPRLVERLTWKKFKKVFVDGPDGVLTGYNEAVQQNPLDAPWIARTRRSGEPVRYGYFHLRGCEGEVVPNDWDRGLLIDYGPPAAPWEPMRFVKDPLVSLTPGSVDLLLGVSYLALGPLRVPMPTYFALLPGAEVPVA